MTNSSQPAEIQEKIAVIYQPAKTAMQSGKAKNGYWLLEFEQSTPKIVDNLIGWQGGIDTLQEIKLKFENKDSAVEYAKKHNLNYKIKEPKKPKLIIKSYADNFIK